MRVLFFAHLKDLTGCAEMELKLSRSVDAAALWQELLARHPGLERCRSSVRLARNHEYAGPETQFADSDEVALIPPVSGG
jgi:molybdopterin converting factor subunit 1